MDNPERVTYFAATDTRGKRIPFGIKQKDRARHMYIIGKTGMGKSTMLENMAIQDIRNGEGLAFIDPHGGTVDKLLDYIPENRIKDVVYFAPFDLEHPIAFNIMEDVGYDKRHLVVSGLMAAFKKIWVDAWSARMEYILTNTLLALLEYPDATLLGVNRMYTDKNYRKKVVENVKDPVVKDFWIKEFATYTDRYTQEATPAIQNKIGQFTSNPLIRNIIGQPTSSFDIRTLMDQKKILIINLSKGLVGDTNTQLLGSMLTTRIFLAAMSRADASARDLARLPNFYFYVDEFQNFANETFAEILSEARKYKLNLIIAHQYIEQMEEEVRDAVFGNVGTTVTFRVGPFDAETLETVFAPEFEQEDLVNLGFAQIYTTLMIDGIGSRPFSAVTIPPIEPPPISTRKEVLASSRATYAALRTDIEEAILKELSLTEEEVTRKLDKMDAKLDDRGYKLPPNKKPKQKQYQQPSPQKAPPQNPPGGAVHAQDLKAAIAAITQKTQATQQEKTETKHEALKETLQKVAAPQPAPLPPKPHPAPQPPVADIPPNKRPAFEVPEESLQAVFEEDL
ncbi:MAG TPA: type IV secretion system DNA-binding domain-containing protein [Candidatus Paceibacterota bacterium]|nr:type IV secretion system DNA-binding domain-containing protein [Candidatus Paceibacterota bacterium]